MGGRNETLGEQVGGENPSNEGDWKGMTDKIKELEKLNGQL